jgi:hypothetical protein
MIKKDVYIESFERYLDTNRECLSMLGNDNFDGCFELLEEYINDLESKEGQNKIADFRGWYKRLKEARQPSEDNKEINWEGVNKMEFALRSEITRFLESLTPEDIHDYQKNSLRKRSNWDEKDNLISLILFFRDKEAANKLFDKMLSEKEWIDIIRYERYYIKDGKKYILSDDYEPFISDEEFNSQSEGLDIDGNWYEIKVKPLKNLNAIRFLKRYGDGVAEAIIEKMPKRGQVWISTNGHPKAKCELMNKIVDFFKEVIPDVDDYAICIPQTCDFKANSHSDDEFLFQLKQPVGEVNKIKQKGINQSTKTISIFLASSSELLEDRKEFEIFINRENKRLNKEGIFLSLELWEDSIDAMSKTRLQDEYNKVVKESDVFISLFFTKVGMYTEEEFETAFGQFKETGKPVVYTYFKHADNYTGPFPDDIQTLLDFKKKLKGLGHFPTEYKNIEDLKLKFKLQLEKILPNL